MVWVSITDFVVLVYAADNLVIAQEANSSSDWCEGKEREVVNQPPLSKCQVKLQLNVP